jgi:hypothetical protein
VIVPVIEKNNNNDIKALIEQMNNINKKVDR